MIKQCNNNGYYTSLKNVLETTSLNTAIKLIFGDKKNSNSVKASLELMKQNLETELKNLS